MKNKVLWLRITLWWGIIADALETIRMAIPNLFLASTGIKLSPDAGFRFGLLYGVPVMVGWTLLLFWANRMPLERKGVVFCLIPVVFAYIVVEIVGISMGIVTLSKMIPAFFLQTILVGLCIFSYVNARENESVRQECRTCA